MLQSHCVRSATMLQSPPPLPPHHVAPMMANDGLRCKHHCDRFGWTHGRHQVHSAHTNLHTAFSTTEVSEISCIHRKGALSTQWSHRHAYCILCDCGHVRCIYRKDALSTQCSHKPAYCILCYWGMWDKLHSEEGGPKYAVLTQTCIPHSLLLRHVR